MMLRNASYALELFICNRHILEYTQTVTHSLAHVFIVSLNVS